MSLNALAVLVKTPGLSPIHTLLAEEIGEDLALEYYHLCIESLRKTLALLPDVKTYWAVEEKEALDHPLWADRERIWVGLEELGAAHYNVYKVMCAKHDRAVLLSVDCPQISNYMLHNVFALLQDYEYVIGPANRANYYLFAGRRHVPLKSWKQARYNKNHRLQYLMENLPSTPFMFGERTEAHVKKDLLSILKQMPSIPHAGQKKLIAFLQKTLSEQ